MLNENVTLLREKKRESKEILDVAGRLFFLDVEKGALVLVIVWHKLATRLQHTVIRDLAASFIIASI